MYDLAGQVTTTVDPLGNAPGYRYDAAGNRTTTNDAQFKISLWRHFYNKDRPHSSLGYLQPTLFRQKWEEVHATKEEPVVS